MTDGKESRAGKGLSFGPQWIQKLQSGQTDGMTPPPTPTSPAVGALKSGAGSFGIGGGGSGAGQHRYTRDEILKLSEWAMKSAKPPCLARFPEICSNEPQPALANLPPTEKEQYLMSKGFNSAAVLKNYNRDKDRDWGGEGGGRELDIRDRDPSDRPVRERLVVGSDSARSRGGGLGSSSQERGGHRGRGRGRGQPVAGGREPGGVGVAAVGGGSSFHEPRRLIGNADADDDWRSRSSRPAPAAVATTAASGEAVASTAPPTRAWRPRGGATAAATVGETTRGGGSGGGPGRWRLGTTGGSTGATTTGSGPRRRPGGDPGDTSGGEALPEWSQDTDEFGGRSLGGGTGSVAAGSGGTFDSGGKYIAVVSDSRQKSKHVEDEEADYNDEEEEHEEEDLPQLVDNVESADGGGGASELGQLKSPPRGERSWFYQDRVGQVQGPFNSHQMLEWNKGGYFQPELMVKRSEDARFAQLADFFRLYSGNPFVRLGNRPESPPPLEPELAPPATSIVTTSTAITSTVVPEAAALMPQMLQMMRSTLEAELEQRARALREQEEKLRLEQLEIERARRELEEKLARDLEEQTRQRQAAEERLRLFEAEKLRIQREEEMRREQQRLEQAEELTRQKRQAEDLARQQLAEELSRQQRQTEELARQRQAEVLDRQQQQAEETAALQRKQAAAEEEAAAKMRRQASEVSSASLTRPAKQVVDADEADRQMQLIRQLAEVKWKRPEQKPQSPPPLQQQQPQTPATLQSPQQDFGQGFRMPSTARWASSPSQVASLASAAVGSPTQTQSLLEIQRAQERALQLEQQKQRQLEQLEREQAAAAARAQAAAGAPWGSARTGPTKSLAEIQAEEEAKRTTSAQQQHQYQQPQHHFVRASGAGGYTAVPATALWSGKVRENAPPQPPPQQQPPPPATSQPTAASLASIWNFESLSIGAKSPNTTTTTSTPAVSTTAGPALVPKPKANQAKQQQPVKTSSSATASTDAVSRKAREEDKAQQVLRQNLARQGSSASDSLTLWCQQQLRGLDTQVDIPTLIELLKDIEDPNDVDDLIKSYLGENARTVEFSKNFLKKRIEFKYQERNGGDQHLSASGASVAGSSSLAGAAGSPAAKSGKDASEKSNNFQPVAGSKKKKKNTKKFKVHSDMLGFTSAPSSTRSNIGQIETAD